LLDQRGTGFSVPSLNCFEMEDFEYDGDPLADCFDRLLNDGVDLDQYNSADSAADVNDLRIALGYDQVNLWGISYGTRLALTVMRDHPDGLRAVVIDSVFPPEVNSVESGVNDTLNAFGYLFEQCAADSTCSSAYPNLEQDFLDVIDGFNNNPPVFEYDDGFEVYELELYGDDIAGALFQTLYNSTAIPMLPLGITLLATAQDEFDLQDGYDIMQGFYTPESWNGEFEDGPESVFESDQVFDYIDQVGDISDSEGMYSSVECAEEIPFNDLDAAFDVADANAPEELLEWLYISAETPVFDCDIWFVEPLPGVENERVQSDIPTLLISGGFDPVTPPSYGDSALEGLSNGQHVVFPFGGHSETGTEGCAADLAAAFVDEPGAAVDASCVPQTIDFYVE
ncbi:MAG: alpha/beta fold hydrolase, partial [Chloroflexota bacterium]